jgi:hypothetical protein
MNFSPFVDFPRAGIEDKLNELRQTLSGVPPNSFEQPILILKDEDVVPAFIEQPIDPQPKKVLKEKPASLNLPKVNDFWNSGYDSLF